MFDICVVNKNIRLLEPILKELLEVRNKKLLLQSYPEIFKRLCPNGDAGVGYGYHENGKVITEDNFKEFRKLVDFENHYKDIIRNLMCVTSEGFNSKSFNSHRLNRAEIEFRDFVDKHRYMRDACTKQRSEISNIKILREGLVGNDKAGVKECDDAIQELRVQIAQYTLCIANEHFKSNSELSLMFSDSIGKDNPIDFEPEHFVFSTTYVKKRLLQLRAEAIGVLDRDKDLVSLRVFTEQEIDIRLKEWDYEFAKEQYLSYPCNNNAEELILAAKALEKEIPEEIKGAYTKEDKSVWIFADKKVAAVFIVLGIVLLIEIVLKIFG